MPLKDSESGNIATPAAPLACEEAELLVSRRIDGELKADEVARLDAHLRVCGNCRSSLESWKDHSELLDESLDGLWTKPSPSVLATARFQKKPPVTRCLWVPVGMVASQCLAVIGLAVYFLLSNSRVEAPQAVIPLPRFDAPVLQPRQRPPVELVRPAPKEVVVAPEPTPQSPPAEPRMDLIPEATAPVPASTDHAGFAAIETVPAVEIDNVGMSYTIPADEGQGEAGRVHLLGDVATGRAVLRIVSVNGAVREVAQKDVDTLVEAPLRGILKRFLQECSRPELRARFAEALKKAQAK